MRPGLYCSRLSRVFTNVASGGWATSGRKSRSLCVRIYAPDDTCAGDQAAAFLVDALSEATGLVADRLRRRAPSGQPMI